MQKEDEVLFEWVLMARISLQTHFSAKPLPGQSRNDLSTKNVIMRKGRNRGEKVKIYNSVKTKKYLSNNSWLIINWGRNK